MDLIGVLCDDRDANVGRVVIYPKRLLQSFVSGR